MAIIRSLDILLRGKTSTLKNDFRPARKELSNLSRQAKGLFTGISFKIAGLAGAIVGVTSLASALAKVNAQFKEIDKLAKTADKLGATVAEMQALKLASSLAGTELGTTEKAVNRLGQVLGKAFGGDESAARSLAKIGLSIKDFDGLSASESLGLVFDTIKGLESQAEKTAAMMEIFGRGGAEIFNLMEGGSAAIKQATKDIQGFGGELSRIDAAKVEQANDAWTRMQTLIDSVFQQLSVGLAPVFTSVVELITDSGSEMQRFGSISAQTTEILVTGIEFINRAWNFFLSGINQARSLLLSMVTEGLSNLAKLEQGLIKIGGAKFDFGISELAVATSIAQKEFEQLAANQFGQAVGQNQFGNDLRSKLKEIEDRAKDIASSVEDNIFAKPIKPDFDLQGLFESTQSIVSNVFSAGLDFINSAFKSTGDLIESSKPAAVQKFSSEAQSAIASTKSQTNVMKQNHREAQEARDRQTRRLEEIAASVRRAGGILVPIGGA